MAGIQLIPRALSFFSMLVLPSCAGGPKKGDDGPSPDSPEYYYPMQVGYVWAHEVEMEEEGPLLLISRVLRREGAKIVLLSADRKLSYKVAGDGIMKDGGFYLYQWPSSTGKSWQIANGTAHILDTSAREETPGGVFQNCLVVEERAEGKKITTSYAPKVGPVKVQVTDGDGNFVVARLKSFTKGDPLM